MEQKIFFTQASGFIQAQQRHRWWIRIVTGLAAAVVFVTTYLLILPAITMGNSIFEVTTASSKVILGETIETEVYALADNSREETYFVLNTDGDNAGLAKSQLDFDSDEVAAIEDENGQIISLHREYTESGEVWYWFVLKSGQSARFSLSWVNGMALYRIAEVESPDLEEPSSEAEILQAEESVSTEPAKSELYESNTDESSSGSDEGSPAEAEILLTEESVSAEPAESELYDCNIDESSYSGDAESSVETEISATEEPDSTEPTGSDLSDINFDASQNGSDDEAPIEAEIPPAEEPDSSKSAESDLYNSDTDISATSSSGTTQSSSENDFDCTLEIDTDIVLEQEGDLAREGSITISFSCGDSLDAAATAGEQYLILSWLPEQLKEVYQYEDDFISVTATPEYEDALPPGTQLQVTLVTADTDGYQYDAYIQALTESYGTGGQTVDSQDILLYDIAFLTEQFPETDGAEPQIIEFQPTEGAVQIHFTFKQPQALILSEENIEDYQVLHLPLTRNVREMVNTTAEATDISAEDVLVEEVEACISDEQVEFSLSSFSLVAFVPQDDGSTLPLSEVTSGLDYTYRDVLGSAINYGITTQELHRLAHLDTTFAASHVTSDDGNITIGAYTGSKGSPLLIGSITGNLRIDGQACTVYTTAEAAENLELQNGNNFTYCTEAEIQNQVTDMISYAEQVSQIMASQRTYSVMKYGWYWNGSENVEGWYIDQNDADLDISNLPAGTYYIDGDTYLNKNNINIKKNSDQTIVFNLTGATVDLRQFQITNVDTGLSMNSGISSDAVYTFASTLIFNMPNANTVNIQSGIFGVLIAPNATVSINSTSSGWIVANAVTNPGGEWHFIYQDLTEPLPVTVSAKKTLDGETPDENIKFSFKVDTWNNGQWTETQTVYNFLGDVLFREILDTPGTYYYRVSEINDGGAYEYDATQYIVKIVVTSIQGNILHAEQTYYMASEISEIERYQPVDKIEFHNTTSVDKPSYTLPETGGPGKNLFTTGGAVLLALTGLMYKITHRKEEPADYITT